MESESDGSRDRGFERFLLFTDAVMAIAVTLLILPLIDSVGDLEHKTKAVGELLSDHQGDLLGFFLSFAVIISLWIQHQKVFAKAACPSRGLVLLGVLWLLSVTFLPFTTALIPDHGSEQATLLLYVGNVAVSIHCLGASTWLLDRHPELLMASSSITTRDHRDAVLSMVLITLSFVLALLFPGLGFSVMLLLVLNPPLRFVWRHFRPEQRMRP